MKKSPKTGAQGPALPVSAVPEQGRTANTPGRNPLADDWMLPAIRGVQAGHEFYVVMMRLRDLHRILAPVDATMPPELRAQRMLNKARVPKIAGYILGNPHSYTFSSLVGAIDGLPRFEPAGEKSRMGTLYIPRTMKVALLDGQHRKAAIEQAVREDNAKKKGSLGVGDETISVVLFIDTGLERSQQKFADLNRFGIRPNGSLALLYDHRDELANLAKAVVQGCRSSPSSRTGRRPRSRAGPASCSPSAPCMRRRGLFSADRAAAARRRRRSPSCSGPRWQP
jgi:DNA sulfur modification protein DndB